MVQGYLQRKTNRNLYYIRYQTVSVLGMTFLSMRSFDFKKWLEESAPTLLQSFDSSDFGSDYYVNHGSDDDSLMDNYAMVLNLCMSANEQVRAQTDEDMRAYGDEMKRTFATPAHTADYTHMYQMHVEWDVEDFILSGAVMHILCTLEELERGLLRTLFLYGAEGGVKDSSRKLIHPTLGDLSKSSPEWEVAENSRSIYSVAGRHAMLESYSINAEPDADWNDRLWSFRTDRNTIARAISTLRYPFQSFLQLHYDAYRALRHLANEAISVQRIAI